MGLKALCTFGPDSDGGVTIGTIRTLLNSAEYSGDDTALTFLRDGNDFYVRVSNADGDHPTDLNDSTQCPNPRCP
jgi:hypothetical protein